MALADGSGTIQTEYSYEPFGGTTTSGGSTSNAFGFTGREADGTGIYYYRARYYDARLQRFVGEDPVGFAGGDSNLHAYVGNTPQNLTDPTGEFAALLVPVAAACIGGAAGNAIAYKVHGRKVDRWVLLEGCLLGAPIGLPPWLRLLNGLPAPPSVPQTPGGGPKPTPKFEPPTNPPQMPPEEVPDG